MFRLKKRKKPEKNKQRKRRLQQKLVKLIPSVLNWNWQQLLITNYIITISSCCGLKRNVNIVYSNIYYLYSQSRSDLACTRTCIVVTWLSHDVSRTQKRLLLILNCTILLYQEIDLYIFFCDSCSTNHSYIYMLCVHVKCIITIRGIKTCKEICGISIWTHILA